MSSFNLIFQECESHLRAGDIELAQIKLIAVPLARLNRPALLPMANLCRRAGLVSLGLRAFSPLVRVEEGRWQSQASPKELAEYAILLQRSGAIQEALWVLNQVDANKVPETHLHKALFQFGVWEGAKAAANLREYLRADLNPYARMIGRVNLAAALIHLQDFAEALELINRLVVDSQTGNYGRLLGNSLELRAQIHFHRGEYAHARRDLQDAANAISAVGSADTLFIRKWNAVLDAVETGCVENLLAFRAEVHERRHWESVREADRYLLKAKFSAERFTRLVFGTPYSAYRRAVEGEHATHSLPKSCRLGAAEAKITFDLKTGEFSEAHPKPTESVYKLIAALTRDFYRPLAIGGLFAELFPDEHFDVQSSIHRVHQSVYRARGWLSARKVPLQIVQEEGEYSLSVGCGLGLVLSLERSPVSAENSRLEILRQSFGQTPFGTREACAVLAVSASSLKVLLSGAVAAGVVARSGLARATRYTFTVDAVRELSAA